jgi:hypothetical protein
MQPAAGIIVDIGFAARAQITLASLTREIGMAADQNYRGDPRPVFKFAGRVGDSQKTQ